MKIFGLAGYSGSGKTTLMIKLLSYFKENGLKIATIKHAHHSFDIDHEGKDSYRHRMAGADEVLIASDRRWALIHENDAHPAPAPLELQQLISHISPCDIILIEGFKSDNFPKIEIWRADNGKDLLDKSHPGILAIACPAHDMEILRGMFDYRGEEIFDLDNTQKIADFILHHAYEANKLA